MENNIFLGQTTLKSSSAKVKGNFVNIEGEKFYKISNYHQMPAFFMTIVSDSDHWMFITSNGSLSAGRKNKDNALFPYYTDDKIADYEGKTGSKTLFLVKKGKNRFLWEPFSKELEKVYSIERNIFKSIYGNKILFEEINRDLELSFRYQWLFSETYGFVKKSFLKNLSAEKQSVEVLDGMINMLPNDVVAFFQNEYSNLADAYKKNELLKDTGLGIFSLSSVPVDKAEPSESLRATTVWSQGLENPVVLISEKQVDNFRKGLVLETEIDIRAHRCAYLVNKELEIAGNTTENWVFAAEINQNTTQVANLNGALKTDKGIVQRLEEDIEKGTKNLIKIVASADGLQQSNEELTAARHFSNTLFNVMRGGVYLNNYTIEKHDFVDFVATINKKTLQNCQKTLEKLPQSFSHAQLMKRAQDTKNADFIRICYEYLPLTFSRRHGDPSRPWNQFSIEIKNEDGSPKSDFQGNWRDIFQNWEALSLSYPEFIENIISKFVNASTPDGYNPYRIMRSGIDWEAPEPGDPWAYIGYWGDHQIIYLQKLLELSEKYNYGRLDDLLTREIFAYANVPYRIKSYKKIVENPRDTIDFDFDLDKKISRKVKEIGADGRLLLTGENEIYKVNLTEKILVSLLAKLSNFVPEAGIWLNTQRPEWNDANNALVGSGVSMVTLYYLRRFLKFWNKKFSQIAAEKIAVSQEVNVLFDTIFSLFAENTAILSNGFSDKERKQFTDQLGLAGEKYRNAVYENGFSGSKTDLNTLDLVHFTEIVLQYIDQSIRKNKRSDGLYHAYNLIAFSESGISIRYLYEMLEGQVAVLSAGSLSPKESLEVLDALKNSKLFRPDQYSYILYPDRDLPRFEEKNNIPAAHVKQSALLKKMAANGETSIVSVDNTGGYHFNGTFRNAALLAQAIDKLDKEKYGTLAAREKEQILSIYEEMFDHQSFTGRSGTFFAFEGLGSIYWHMVSKLLLAAEESFFRAIDKGADAEITGRLKAHYYEIKAGIGLYKSPELYGAFPTDAYSHTPAHAGAKQPGMTGQVKEDIIARFGELGVRVDKQQIAFDKNLLNEKEILQQDTLFEPVDLSGTIQKISLENNQMAFTICQTPVVYTFSGKEMIKTHYKNGKTEEIAGLTLDAKQSKLIFSRSGEIEKIEVHL